MSFAGRVASSRACDTVEGREWLRVPARRARTSSLTGSRMATAEHRERSEGRVGGGEREELSCASNLRLALSSGQNRCNANFPSFVPPSYSCGAACSGRAPWTGRVPSGYRVAAPFLRGLTPRAFSVARAYNFFCPRLKRSSIR